MIKFVVFSHENTNKQRPRKVVCMRGVIVYRYKAPAFGVQIT